MDPDLVRLYGLIFAPTAIALLDMLRFRRPTWQAAGERRALWAVLVLLAPWLGPGFYATGPRLRLVQAVQTRREQARAALRPRTRELRVVVAEDDGLTDWLAVHDAVDPDGALSPSEVATMADDERLTLAYVDDELVGSGRLHIVEGQDATIRVVVRILPEHRGHGWGESLLEVETAVARGLGARTIDTVLRDGGPVEAEARPGT